MLQSWQWQFYLQDKSMQQSWTEEKSKFYLEKYKRMGNIEQNIYIIEFFRSFDSKYEPPRDHETRP